MFVERNRLGIKAFEIRAEHVEKRVGCRAAAFVFSFENHNLSSPHGASDVFAERCVEVWPDQQNDVKTAGKQCHGVAVVIKAKHRSNRITTFESRVCR